MPGSVEETVQIYNTATEVLCEFELEETPAILSGNAYGRIFAYTCSSGNLIKIMSLEDGKLVKTYNRGKDKAEITSISFNTACIRMAVSSNKSTVHVFSLPKELYEKAASNYKNKVICDSLDSEFSAAKASINLLESRHGASPGLFQRYILGSEGEASYLKVYVDYPEKICTIYKNFLVILRADGVVHYIDVQEEGKYNFDHKKIKTVELFTQIKQKETQQE